MFFNEIPENHPTPSLVVDGNILQGNLDRMQKYCTEHKLKLRPHTKTHKSVEIASRQIASGASGLTVAKVGEAECMFAASPDIFLAYPAIGQNRLERLGDLAARCADRGGSVCVGVDSQQAAEFLSAAAANRGLRIGILVDLDVGFHRTGVESSQDAVALCQWIDQCPNLNFQGVMCFPGQILPNAPDDAWAHYTQRLAVVVDVLRRSGIVVPRISGGSTPSACESHRNPYLNEIRPGTYIYNDLNEVRLGVATIENCAARIIATVVSTPTKSKFILDSGSKTLSSDRNCVDPDSGFGMVVEYPAGKISRLSEEHGEVTFPENYTGPRPNIGDRVWIIPNHICVCVNLQNNFYLAENNKLSEYRVDARGLLT